ncbi:3-hydroxybutyryl-CoA dehydrogenase [Acidovorax sp. NO-1]|jgi:3-hydroxybutyryl-CoA dehydrogenase|uniref:3-hydroxyacyl-CoA dehydrogenase n=1 Tax=unclassified Acidovorax TaxID=2684926 RepID=UPI00023FC695|nr:3-hydroxyacyl-CoA dehydrogenase [Acidovorax sp. NO-1]EHL22000.1 3-hydroxybutyryl-CoA dehydrogenase [Acidovorax sp. NO-1]
MSPFDIPVGAQVCVIGAGLMGAGIAQIAAQAGDTVLLFDKREGAAEDALRKLRQQLTKLAERGRMTEAQAQQTLGRIRPAQDLAQASGCSIVIEAIVEDAAVKRDLFASLEAIVASDCILASNTSSISITALANGMQRPERLVGMHFFNPVPAMQLVEVISGLKTHAQVAAAVERLGVRWGKTPVHARSTPGFIVNRIARPFYAEALNVLTERASCPADIDRCLRAVGFRMGPCELMDLIGHDTNLAVTRSMFSANYSDRRFGPSLVQQELVDGGLLGRKSGEGFYRHNADHHTVPSPVQPGPVAAWMPPEKGIILHGRGGFVERMAARLAAMGASVERCPDSGWSGIETPHGQLRVTDGRTAAQLAFEKQAANLAVCDLVLPNLDGNANGGALAWTAAPAATPAWRDEVQAMLQFGGWEPVLFGDVAGLLVARTIVMLINEACDAVLQGVCSEGGADTAMKLGANYPDGPFHWLEGWCAGAVVAVLDHLDGHYRGERYRASPGLRRRAWGLN